MKPTTLALTALLGITLGVPIAAYAAPPFDHSRAPLAAPVPEGPPAPPAEPRHRSSVDPMEMLSGPAFLSSDKARRLGLSSPPPSAEAAEEPERAAGNVSIDTLSDGSQYTLAVTNDIPQDTEPTVRTLTIGSVTHTAVVAIKYLAPRFKNYFATTTDFANWTRGQLPIPSNYTQSGDPLMDENSYSSGIAPDRMYTTGILFQDINTYDPSAIGLWHSDDGGATWSQPTLVDSESNPNTFLDKPAINVSQWSGDLGTVFVAYVLFNFTNTELNQLRVARSSDGGVTFSAPAVVATGNIEMPQIVSSPYGDKIYVLWVDFDLNAIRMSTSTSSLTSWTAPETAATGSFVTDTNPNLNGNVRAATIPMVRYNWVTNSLGVVWHEFESPTSSKTDIFFVAKNSAGWHAKTRINPVTTNDQFQPGIDFDNNGHFMVTFYDRSQDPNNLLYKESWVRIDYLGNVLNSGALSVPASDPNAYGNKFIGDYQDSWWWTFSDQYGNRFNAVWTQQTSNTTGNTYVTGIQ